MASGTLATNLGSKFELRINGDSYGLTEVRSTIIRDYRFVLHTPLPATAKFELIYRNDYERDGQKRALFIDSITINGASISATAQGVLFDRGSGAQAFDNLDVQPGQSTLTSNGALRFTYAPKVAVPPIVGVTPPPAVTPPTPVTPPGRAHTDIFIQSCRLSSRFSHVARSPHKRGLYVLPRP